MYNTNVSPGLLERACSSSLCVCVRACCKIVDKHSSPSPRLVLSASQSQGDNCVPSVILERTTHCCSTEHTGRHTPHRQATQAGRHHTGRQAAQQAGRQHKGRQAVHRQAGSTQTGRQHTSSLRLRRLAPILMTVCQGDSARYR